MEAYLWPIVVVVAIALVNYRVGQFLAPPAKDEVNTLIAKQEAQERFLIEVNSKVNSLMMDKGFKK